MTQNNDNNLEKNYVNVEQKDQLLNYLLEAENLDFRHYSEASVRRRISKILDELQLEDVSSYIDLLRNTENSREEFIERFTVNVTEMFRDPFFYQTLIEKVFPELAPKENIRIWSAGCSTGEEILSLAILLKEQGLLKKTHIVGTDLSLKVLQDAARRTYKFRHVDTYEKPYQASGGNGLLSDYYQRHGDMVVFDASLYQNVIFKAHNLLDETLAQDFDMVICRNVLIYFNSILQDKVLDKLSKALKPNGYLVLGSKESIIFYQERGHFHEIESESRIYKKDR